MSSYKSEQRTTTLGACVGDAFSQFESLLGEMREMEENMSGNNMEHLPKYEVIAEAVSELENHETEPDVPECLADIEVKYSELVQKRKGRGPSRATQLSNAQAMLQAAIDVLEDEDNELIKKHADEADELRQELDEHANFDVEFPGMFG